MSFGSSAVFCPWEGKVPTEAVQILCWEVPAMGEDLELNRPIFPGKISIRGILTPPICASWKWKPHPGRGSGVAKPVVRPARLRGRGWEAGVRGAPRSGPASSSAHVATFRPVTPHPRLGCWESAGDPPWLAGADADRLDLLAPSRHGCADGSTSVTGNH